MTLPICLYCGSASWNHGSQGTRCAVCGELDSMQSLAQREAFLVSNLEAQRKVIAEQELAIAHYKPTPAPMPQPNVPEAFSYRDAPPSPPVVFRRPIAEEEHDDDKFDEEVFRSNVRIARAERMREAIALFTTIAVILCIAFLLWALCTTQ